MKIWWILFLFIGFVSGQTYYVSNSGNDSWDGKSDATAWKTIGKINSFNFAVGDDVYFKRGNNFTNARLFIDWSGSENNRVYIGAYGEGSKPVFDGKNLAPFSNQWGSLVTIEGWDYVTVENLKIINSYGIGLRFTDEYNSINGAMYGEAKNIDVSMTGDASIQFNGDYTKYGLIENCTATLAGMGSEGSSGRIPNNSPYNIWWPYNNPDWWPFGIGATYADNVIVKNNIVHDVFAEGIGFYKGSDNCVAENNTVYNTWSGSIYIDAGKNNIIRNNLVYGTNDLKFKERSIDGVGVCDEGLADIRSENNSIYNNLIAFLPGGITIDVCRGAIFKNSEVYGNTLIENTNGVTIHCTGFENSYFKNNIIYSSNESHVMVKFTLYTPGLEWGNNLWARHPGSNSTFGSNSIIDNPKLFKEDDWNNIEPGSLSIEDFVINSNSSVINKGVNLSSKYSRDFFGNTRGADGKWDIGAIEYQGVISPPVLENCNNSVDDDSDGLIDCLDSNCPACAPPVDVVDVSDIFAKISEWKAGWVSLDDVFVVIRAWGEGGWF